MISNKRRQYCVKAAIIIASVCYSEEEVRVHGDWRKGRQLGGAMCRIPSVIFVLKHN